MLSSRFVLVNFGPHNSRAKNFRTAANSTKTVERQRGNLPRIHYVLKLIKKALMCVASAPDSTRPMMIGEVLAISLAVPAISWANWPMAFFEHYLCMPYVSFSRPENQNPARRHHLAQIAKSPILRVNYVMRLERDL